MANPVRVVWLNGSAHERRLTLENIRRRLSSHETKVLEGDFTYAFMEQQIACGSVFSDKRLYIVKDMPKPSGTKATMLTHLKKLLDGLPEDVIVVFNGIDADEEKALSSHVEKIGKKYDFVSKLDPRTAAGWVVAQFADAGKTISEEDAQVIVDTGGYDESVKGIGTDVLRLSIKKICWYIGNRKKNVTREDVVANAFPSEEFIIWQVADAMDSKDLGKCYDMFARLVQDSGSVESAVITMFSIINGKYRLLLFCKEALARNLTKAQVAKEAAEFVKLKQSGKDFQMTLTPVVTESGANKGNLQPLWSDFAIQAALNGNFGRKPTVDAYSRKDLFRIIQVLQDAASEMRYRTTDASLLLLVDSLFFAICGKLDDTQLATLRRSYD